MRPHSKRSPPATCGTLGAADTGVFAIADRRFAHVSQRQFTTVSLEDRFAAAKAGRCAGGSADSADRETGACIKAETKKKYFTAELPSERVALNYGILVRNHQVARGHCTPSKRVRVERVAANWTASEQQRQLPGSLNPTFGNPKESDSREPVRFPQRSKGRVEDEICGQSSTYDNVMQDV